MRECFECGVRGVIFYSGETGGREGGERSERSGGIETGKLRGRVRLKRI